MFNEVLDQASKRRASREELFDAVQGELTDSHRFVLDEIMQHIEEIEARITRFEARLLGGLKPEHNALALLQTVPGIDLVGAASSDMTSFGVDRHLLAITNLQSGRARKGNTYVRRLLCAHAACRLCLQNGSLA
jgi:transposase